MASRLLVILVDHGIKRIEEKVFVTIDLRARVQVTRVASELSS